jgi:hypothetical protein
MRFMWRPLRLFLIGLIAAAGVLVALRNCEGDLGALAWRQRRRDLNRNLLARNAAQALKQSISPNAAHRSVAAENGV